MAKQNTKPKRLPLKFIKDMDGILDTRVKTGLMNYKEARFPKAIKLLRRTQGYQMSLKELKVKKEKKNE